MVAKRAILGLLVFGLLVLTGCKGDPNASAKEAAPTPNLKPTSKKNTKNLDIGID